MFEIIFALLFYCLFFVIFLWLPARFFGMVFNGPRHRARVAARRRQRELSIIRYLQSHR